MMPKRLSVPGSYQRGAITAPGYQQREYMMPSGLSGLDGTSALPANEADLNDQEVTENGPITINHMEARSEDPKNYVVDEHTPEREYELNSNYMAVD